ncbi:hypothetical protein B0H14DRAFT_2556919 [Mycena olivaceomarginata]|nr:hypothetical protein B0H14DRAFT_2556919 [Mycena olivaceomarginata]
MATATLTDHARDRSGNDRVEAIENERVEVMENENGKEIDQWGLWGEIAVGGKSWVLNSIYQQPDSTWVKGHQLWSTLAKAISALCNLGHKDYVVWGEEPTALLLGRSGRALCQEAEGARYAKRLLASRATTSAEQERALSAWRWVRRRRDEAPEGATQTTTQSESSSRWVATQAEVDPEQMDEEGEDEEAGLDTDVDMDIDDTASNQEEDDHFSQYDADFPELADNTQMEDDLRLEAASWDSDGIVEEPEAVPATSTRRKQAEKENMSPSTLVQTKQPPVGKKLKQATQPPTTPVPAKRKRQEETTSVQQSKKVRSLQLKLTSLSSPVIPPPSKPALVVVPSPAAPLPSICPSSYCNDTLPANPSDELLALFARKQEILKSSKPGSTYDLTRQICTMIKSDNKRYACVQEAQRNGWAFNIDLDGLPDRVLELQDHLLDLICDDRALDECPIWQNFLEQISYKVHAFSLAEIGSFAPAADRAARCGYYGPTGKTIISSTLYDYVNKATSWIQIHHTIITLTDTPQQWDRPGRNGTLLSEAQFIDSDYGDLRNTDILIRHPPPASDPKPTKPPMSLVNIKSKKQSKPPTLVDSNTHQSPKKLSLTDFPPPQIKKKFSEPEKPAITAIKSKKTKNTAPTEPVRSILVRMFKFGIDAEMFVMGTCQEPPHSRLQEFRCFHQQGRAQAPGWPRMSLSGLQIIRPWRPGDEIGLILSVQLLIDILPSPSSLFSDDSSSYRHPEAAFRRTKNIQQAYIAPLPHRASPQLSPAHALEVGTEFAVPLRQLGGLPRRGVKFVAVTANLNSRPATFDIASMSARTLKAKPASDQWRSISDTTWAEAVLLCDPNLLHFRARGADSTRFECLFEFSVTPVNPSAGCLFEILGAWFDASQKRGTQHKTFDMRRLALRAKMSHSYLWKSACPRLKVIVLISLRMPYPPDVLRQAVFVLQSGNNLSDSAAKFSLS